MSHHSHTGHGAAGCYRCAANRHQKSGTKGDDGGNSKIREGARRSERLNARNNLQMAQCKAEQVKVETLEKEIAKITLMKNIAPQQWKDIALEEQYVLGGEEELEFTKATPSPHIRNLFSKEQPNTTRRCHLATRMRMTGAESRKRLA